MKPPPSAPIFPKLSITGKDEETVASLPLNTSIKLLNLTSVALTEVAINNEK